MKLAKYKEKNDFEGASSQLKVRTFLYSIGGFSNPSYVNSTTPKVISFGTCYHGPFLHLDSVKTRH